MSDDMLTKIFANKDWKITKIFRLFDKHNLDWSSPRDRLYSIALCEGFDYLEIKRLRISKYNFKASA